MQFIPLTGAIAYRRALYDLEIAYGTRELDIHFRYARVCLLSAWYSLAPLHRISTKEL